MGAYPVTGYINTHDSGLDAPVRGHSPVPECGCPSEMASGSKEAKMNVSEASREHTGSSEVFCQGCGSRNDESFAYCVACGSELGPRREARQERTKDGDRRSNGDLWSWIGDSANLMYGQKVLVVARWILVVSGLLLALLNPVVLGEVKIQVGLILTLAVANFFLHVQLIRNQPSLPWVAYLASAVDVLAITMMVVNLGWGRFQPVRVLLSRAVRDFSGVPTARRPWCCRGRRLACIA